MKQRGDKQVAGGEQLQANAIVQAYCSTLDAYINAQVVGCTQHGTCVVTLLGVTETLEVEVSSVDWALRSLHEAAATCSRVTRCPQVQSLRPGVPADPAVLTSGSKCDAV